MRSQVSTTYYLLDFVLIKINSQHFLHNNSLYLFCYSLANCTWSINKTSNSTKGASFSSSKIKLQHHEWPALQISQICKPYCEANQVIYQRSSGTIISCDRCDVQSACMVHFLYFAYGVFKMIYSFRTFLFAMSVSVIYTWTSKV